MMKKTLLFLMGHCVIFVSHAGNEEGNVLVPSQYAVLAGIAKFRNSSTQTTTINNQEIFASSPASVSFIDEMIQQSVQPKKNSLPIEKHVFFRHENKFIAIQRLTIRRPISLESQASHQELHGLGSFIRGHSSQSIDLKDHPTPDLGKTPEKDRHDHPTPELSKRTFSQDSYDLHYDHPTPPIKSEDEGFEGMRLRSHSSDSDFFLGSVSLDSPRTSRKLFGQQRHLTPDLGSPSPRK